MKSDRYWPHLEDVRPIAGSQTVARVDRGVHSYVATAEEAFVPTFDYLLCTAQQWSHQ